MKNRILAGCLLACCTAGGAVVDVTSLGVSGDGKTDASEAVNRAIAGAAAGDVIYFPAGEYFFASDLIVAGEHLTLTGEGTLIFEHRDFDEAYNDNRKIHITGRDITVSGLSITSTAASRSAVYGLVNCVEAENIRLTGLDIYNSPSTAIFTIACKKMWILDNYIHDQWADGIHISRASEEVLIRGNIIDHNGDDGIGVVSYHGPESWNSYSRNDRIVITDNVISRTPARGICASGGNLTISGNQISETGKAGIICTNEGWISGRTLIRGNIIHDTGTANHYGFDFYDMAGTRSGIHVQYNRDMLIDGNLIYNQANGYAVSITASPNITVSGNQIANAVRGIVAEMPQSLLDDGFPAGLLEELYGGSGLSPLGDIPGCDNLVISGNTVRDCQADGIYVVGLEDRPCLNVVVRDNILSGNNREGGASVRDVWAAHCRSLALSGNVSHGGGAQGTQGCETAD